MKVDRKAFLAEAGKTIILINPETTERTNPQIYMSILYLATALDRKGYKVKVIDSQVENAKKKLNTVIDKSLCIGFSVMTSQVKHALDLSDYAKSINKDIPIIWGGTHPTLFSLQTLMDKSVDYVIRGEGEMAFLEFLEYINGKRKIENVGGLVYKTKGKVRINPENEFLDINTLSPPSWHLIDIEKYIWNFSLGGKNYGKYMTFHSGRGCPYRCTFCINTILREQKWRPLSAEKIMEEIRIIKKKYDIEYVKFVDENFFLDKKRLEKFCRLMIKENLGIKWHATCRANYFRETHMDDNLLKLVKKSGCAVVAMGIESGSQKVLDHLKKDIKVEDAFRAVGRCREAGIVPICSFMIGIPGETKADMNKTHTMIRKIKEINKDSVIIGPQIFRPYPGCELYNEIKGMLKEPESLREWAKTEISGGYISPEKEPWIEDPRHLTNMRFYMILSQSSTSGIATYAKLPFKILSDIRNRYGFFDFPIEKEIYERGKRIYYTLKKTMT